MEVCYPHLLTEEQKLKRVHDSQALYEVLIQCQSRQFRNILTGDQSWFSFTYGMKRAWVMPEDDNPEFDGSKISSNKIMVTVIWGVNGIYLVDFLEEGQTFNTTYFINHIYYHSMKCHVIFGPNHQKERFGSIWIIVKFTILRQQ